MHSVMIFACTCVVRCVTPVITINSLVAKYDHKIKISEIPDGDNMTCWRDNIKYQTTWQYQNSGTFYYVCLYACVSVCTRCDGVLHEMILLYLGDSSNSSDSNLGQSTSLTRFKFALKFEGKSWSFCLFVVEKPCP